MREILRTEPGDVASWQNFRLQKNQIVIFATLAAVIHHCNG
jgi:hypothetical protein